MTTPKDEENAAGPADDENPDPISGASGSHPFGTGIGAASGAAAGASIGAVAGPFGAAVGTLVGAVAGALAGKEAAEAIKPTAPGMAARQDHVAGVPPAVDPTAEHDYWRRHYATRPYVTPGAAYETYRQAYEFGWEGYRRHHGRPFAEVENELRREWERTDREMSWDGAKDATRDAWQRIGELRPADERGHR